MSQEVWCPDLYEGWAKGLIVSSENMGKVKVKKENGQEFLVKTDELLQYVPEYLTPVDDMITLGELNEAIILYILKERFKRDTIYTYIGPMVVSVNPFKIIPKDGEVLIPKFASGSQDVPPHIYSLARNAFKDLVNLGESQAIIISGESGAGKTEATKIILKYLTVVSMGSTNKELSKMILCTNPILEAFGNARTVRNNNSSRFGKLIKLQFNRGGSIEGASINTYLLENTRIVFQAPEERNYHIFYQLIAGAPPKVLQMLGLNNNPANYKYLTNGNLKAPGMDDTENFKTVLQSFATLGFSEAEINDILRILAGILHLGNIEFESEDKVSIKNLRQLDAVCDIISVEKKALERALTQRLFTGGGRSTSYTIPLNKAQALENRDALSKTLYSNLFDKLVKRLNQVLSSKSNDSDKKPVIALLDIYGFEIFKVNSLEQFCINYANEKLHEQFNKHMFKAEQEEYKNEGIPWKDIPFIDNQGCIELIEKPYVGILSLLNEEVQLPKGSEQSLLRKLEQNHKSSKHFTYQPRQPLVFEVSHYAGKVPYTITGFLEKNKNTLNADLTKVISMSTQDFTRSLLGEEDFESVESKSQTRFNKNAPKEKGSSKATVCQLFKKDLTSLADLLNSCQRHYVRCLKPNEDKKSDVFDAAMILKQMKSNGILETISLRKAGYSSKMTPEIFFNRYGIIGVGSNVDGILRFLKNNYANNQFALGKTKIFVKSEISQDLEERKKKYLSGNLVKIQCFIRRYNAMRYLVDLIRAEIIRRKELERKRREEEERRKREEIERRRKLEEEKRRKEEAERLKREEDERKRKDIEEKRRILEEQRIAKDEDDKRRKAEDELRRRAEETRREEERTRKLEQEKKQREEQERKLREDQERKQKEEQERKQREEQLRKEREEQEKMIREERERKQREEQERKQREEQLRKEREEQERMIREEQRLLEKKRQVEEEQRKLKELEAQKLKEKRKIETEINQLRKERTGVEQTNYNYYDKNGEEYQDHNQGYSEEYNEEYTDPYYQNYSEEYYDPNAYSEQYYDPNAAYTEEYYDPNSYTEEYYDPNAAYTEEYYDPNATYTEEYYDPNTYTEEYYDPNATYTEEYYDPNATYTDTSYFDTNYTENHQKRQPTIKDKGVDNKPLEQKNPVLSQSNTQKSTNTNQIKNKENTNNSSIKSPQVLYNSPTQDIKEKPSQTNTEKPSQNFNKDNPAIQSKTTQQKFQKSPTLSGTEESTDDETSEESDGPDIPGLNTLRKAVLGIDLERLAAVNSDESSDESEEEEIVLKTKTNPSNKPTIPISYSTKSTNVNPLYPETMSTKQTTVNPLTTNSTNTTYKPPTTQPSPKVNTPVSSKSNSNQPSTNQKIDSPTTIQTNKIKIQTKTDTNQPTVTLNPLTKNSAGKTNTSNPSPRSNQVSTTTQTKSNTNQSMFSQDPKSPIVSRPLPALGSRPLPSPGARPQPSPVTTTSWKSVNKPSVQLPDPTTKPSLPVPKTKTNTNINPTTTNKPPIKTPVHSVHPTKTIKNEDNSSEDDSEFSKPRFSLTGIKFPLNGDYSKFDNRNDDSGESGDESSYTESESEEEGIQKIRNQFDLSGIRF